MCVHGRAHQIVFNDDLAAGSGSLERIGGELLQQRIPASFHHVQQAAMHLAHEIGIPW